MHPLSVTALFAFLLSCDTLAQTEPLYLSDGDGDRIVIVQNGMITQTFPAVPPIRAFPLAIVDTIRVTGYDPGEIGGEYTLAGVPTGTTYPLNQGDDMSDGCTDGTTYNYGIAFTGEVWRYDRDWANGTQIFVATDHAGITYDLTDDTLWLSRDRDPGISHYSLTGTLLGSFTTVSNLDWIMALEPSTDTLWASSRGTEQLVQYDKMGNLLQTVSVSGMRPSSFFSGEFRVGVVGELVQVDAPDATVVAGLGGYQVTMTVDNGGINPVDLSMASLTFTGTADRTSEYTVTPAPGNPTQIAPGGTAMLAFTVDVSLLATQEPITLDGEITLTDTMLSSSRTLTGATTTDQWDVIACSAPTCGDCNGDLMVTILDALTAAQHAAAIITLTGTDFSNCNVTGVLEPFPMAEVNVLDALSIAQEAAGLPVMLLCC